MPSSVARHASRKELGGREDLGGSEDLFVGVAIEGELVPLFAHEYGAPRAPIFFRAENDQLLFALFARNDDLLLWKTLHLYKPP